MSPRRLKIFSISVRLFLGAYIVAATFLPPCLAQPVDISVHGTHAPRGYLLELSKHLASLKKYPKDAQKLGIEGRIVAKIKIDRNGHLLSYELSQLSGKELLDEAARSLIINAAPYPAFPPNLEGNEVEFFVPIQYNLNNATK